MAPVGGAIKRTGSGFGGDPRGAVKERLVDGGREESWVRVPVHQRVDLQLRVLEGERRRLLHLPVNHLPDPRIQTHLGGTPHEPVKPRPPRAGAPPAGEPLSYLFGRLDGDVVLVDGARLLLDGALVDFLFEVFAGQPEHHVVLAVLRPQELAEHVPSRRVPHQLVKGLRPQPDLVRRRFGAAEGKISLVNHVGPDGVGAERHLNLRTFLLT